MKIGWFFFFFLRTGIDVISFEFFFFIEDLYPSLRGAKEREERERNVCMQYYVIGDSECDFVSCEFDCVNFNDKIRHFDFRLKKKKFQPPQMLIFSRFGKYFLLTDKFFF